MACIFRRHLVGVAVVLLIALGGSAQEPAFFYGSGAVRYAEAPGYFDYVIPCKIRDRKAAGGAESPTVKFEGICWPIIGSMVMPGSGTETPGPLVTGSLLVSPTVVHFEPIYPANAGAIPDMNPAEIKFSYIREKVVALLQTGSGTLVFQLNPQCEGCDPGTVPTDPAKEAQVDGEYAGFGESLSDYAGLAKRIKEQAAYVEVSIAPKTQPGLGDVAEAMPLYSELNQKLAPMCAEPARACVLQFSAYEACKTGNLQAECGAAPTCEAKCALTETGFKSLNATVCRPPNDRASMLIPDWSAAGEKLRAQQKENRDRMTAGETATPAAPTSALPVTSTGQLDFMGKPVDPSAGCTVEQGYAMAMMIASTQEISGGPGSFPAGTAVDVSRLSGGVAASNMLSKVNPVYPAVAKAAHVTGTVVLHVLITETGEVTNLTVVSGPPLLQAAAVDAVKQWRYKPYVVNGVVRKVDTTVFVHFNLGGTPGGPPVAK